MAKVFLSHASEDRAPVAELRDWLISQGHQLFLDDDLSNGLVIGEEWERRLHERLRWADAVVCVIRGCRRRSSPTTPVIRTGPVNAWPRHCVSSTSPAVSAGPMAAIRSPGCGPSTPT